MSWQCSVYGVWAAQLVPGHWCYLVPGVMAQVCPSPDRNVVTSTSTTHTQTQADIWAFSLLIILKKTYLEDQWMIDCGHPAIRRAHWFNEIFLEVERKN